MEVKSLKGSLGNLKADLENLKLSVANSYESFRIEPVFEKLLLLIRGNSDDIDKLRTEYLKEIQEKKQFFEKNLLKFQ